MESTIWKPTLSIRWDIRTESIMRDKYTTVGCREWKVLQQLWQGDKGHQEWRDIEINS